MKLLRERLQRYSPQTLLTKELLAVLLSTGSGSGDTLKLAARLLARYGELGELTQADRRELCHELGLSEASALLFQVVLELSKLLSLPQTEERYQVISPANAARLVMPEMACLDYEQLHAIVPDTKSG